MSSSALTRSKAIARRLAVCTAPGLRCPLRRNQHDTSRGPAATSWAFGDNVCQLSAAWRLVSTQTATPVQVAPAGCATRHHYAAAAAAAAARSHSTRIPSARHAQQADRGEAGPAEPSDVIPAKIRQAWHRPDVAVVLVMPQIPQNTGNVARTCAATGTPLHLVGPLGFQLDDAKLKRAGLDYWDAVTMSVHPTWADFYAFFCRLPEPKRLVAFSVYGDSYYAAPEFRYQPGDWLVFGAETSGLPLEAHEDVRASGGALVKIPIRDTHVRSINLAVSAGVGLFEAIRQLDEPAGHVVAPRLSPTLEEVAARHKDGKRLELAQ